MAGITGWVGKLSGSRSGTFATEPVELSYSDPGNRRAMINGGRLKIAAMRADGQYVALYLSQRDVDLMTAALLDYASAKVKELIIPHLLRNLSHAKLLRALAIELRKRVRLPKDR
jgi:hypothetical protein